MPQTLSPINNTTTPVGIVRDHPPEEELPIHHAKLESFYRIVL